MLKKNLFYEVAVDLPIYTSLYYRIPEGLASLVDKGKRVVVPIGRRRSVGYVVGLPNTTSSGFIGGIEKSKIKDIIDILDEAPLFDDRHLALYKWISAYYFAPLGEVIRTAMVGETNPKSDKLFEKVGRKKHRKRKHKAPPLLNKENLTQDNHTLSSEQEKALNSINKGLHGEKFSPYLLFGVTGSGKTEVYLRAIKEALMLKKKAIFLIPEISLAPRFARILLAEFPDRVAIIHSGLTKRDRYEQWQGIKKGKVDIVVGTRSAVFAPLKDLGLIIVDEEHDPSYKQEEGVKYNARDVALMMGKLLKLTVVLGSATPSIESFYNTKVGKLSLLELTQRVEDKGLPKVDVIDMKGKQKDSVISEVLEKAIEVNLEAGLQTILFLNRRGFSSFILCKDCGYIYRCENCNVSLTLHKGNNILKCHYCNLSRRPPDRCTNCNGYNLMPVGLGTEKLEEKIRKIFPDAGIARLDMDTARKKSHRGVIDDVENGKVDILIGTQMVTKGHHFPGVTLVGVVSGDTSLGFPDFRASERTFQLVTQVAGRAGRGDVSGRVIVQTFNPQEGCFQKTICHDYPGFYEEEIAFRKETGYPPFLRIVSLRFEGKEEDKVSSSVKKIERICKGVFRKAPGFAKGITILGPSPAFLSRLRGKYRWHILIKGKEVKALHLFVREIQESALKRKALSGVKMIVDVDPVNLL
ncbi:MAG: primosomal protein N' [Thermodesulfobacteriota bacterium]